MKARALYWAALVGALSLASVTAIADTMGDGGPWGLVEDYLSGSGVFAGDVHLNDDKMITFGNTAAAPDCAMMWNTTGTDHVALGCTNVDGAGTDGDIFTVNEGTDDVVFVGNVSTVAGTVSAEQLTSTDDMSVTDLCDCGRVTIDGQLSHETNTVTCATATDDFDINWANGNIAFLDMEDCDQDANDVNAPTNAVEGSSYAIIIEQSTAGTEDLTWNAVFLFAGGSDPVLTQTNNARDVVTCLYVDSIYHCAFGQDYQ